MFRADMENGSDSVIKQITSHNFMANKTNVRIGDTTITPITISPRKANTSRSRISRPRETEEEAIIRRFHDAQRMARFRARKKKALEEQQSNAGRKVGKDEPNVEKLQQLQQQQPLQQPQQSAAENRLENQIVTDTETKYSQLLTIIERIGKDIRLSYTGSRSSAERLKSGIVRARTLVRDCLIETRLNLRQ